MIDSKDILFFVLAFCVLWFTLFLSWLIWQVASILKNVNDAVSDARDAISLMEKAITAIREKFDHATSVFAVVGKGIERVVEYAIDKKRESKEKEM